MLTIYPHESGIAWASYLFDLGRYNEIPRLHIVLDDQADRTLCGIQIGRFWIYGDDDPVEPTMEAWKNFTSAHSLGCKRCARQLRKLVNQAAENQDKDA